MCKSLRKQKKKDLKTKGLKWKKKYRVSQIYDLYFKDYVASSDRRLSMRDEIYEAVNKSCACRTKKLGIAYLCCEGCGVLRTITRCCKHRFCSSCGAGETQRWINDLLPKLLNIKHYHVTFTLPNYLRGLSKLNGNKLHDLLFKESSKVLRGLFKEKHGLLPGLISVLHTSGSDLKYHPHVHIILSGGGKRMCKVEEGSAAYEELSSNYLADQYYLGELFRKSFEQSLLKLCRNGDLKLLKGMKGEGSLESWLKRKGGLKGWVVHVEKPLSDLHQIVGYVGRYTKRACISEYKLEQIEGEIKLRYKDYKRSERREAALESIKSYKPYEFLDALLQHVPLPRYRMVRYYGLYNSRYMKDIPKELRLAEAELSYEEELNIRKAEVWVEDWGLYAKYRKSLIRSGQGDPLWCESCKREFNATKSC